VTPGDKASFVLLRTLQESLPEADKPICLPRPLRRQVMKHPQLFQRQGLLGKSGPKRLQSL
jgi:hypothetical protein